MTVTSTEFLASVKRLITQPSNQKLFVDTDFYAMGDRKLKDTIVPLLDSLNGEFFVRTATLAMVSGQSEYRLPARAYGRKLREVKIVNSAGYRFDFPKIEIEREQLYQISGVPFGFYFKGDRFAVVPAPNSTAYSIQYWYFLAPSKIVDTASAALITAISGNDVTVSTLPTTIVAGSIIDFIEGIQGNACISLDKTIASVAGTVLTFTAGDVPTDLAIGDYISLASYSPVLQIPDNAVPYLVTLTCMDVLQALSDYEGYEALSKIADSQRRSLMSILEPRIEGEATRIVNSFGLVNRGFGYRRFGSYNV